MNLAYAGFGWGDPDVAGLILMCVTAHKDTISKRPIKQSL